jgi:lysozyme family protein
MTDVAIPEVFLEAYAFTRSAEGGYVDDPSDYGGETYKGVSRVYWPNWPGWKVVDELKEQEDFPECLYADEELNYWVKHFYYENFWNHSQLNLDSVSSKSKEIAAEMFDCSVNMGVKRAAEFLQRTLNMLNRDQALFEDLKVDGWAGTRTAMALTKCLSVESDIYVLKLLLILRGSFYVGRAEEDSTQERFIRGWVNRLVIDKIQ